MQYAAPTAAVPLPYIELQKELFLYSSVAYIAACCYTRAWTGCYKHNGLARIFVRVRTSGQRGGEAALKGFLCIFVRFTYLEPVFFILCLCDFGVFS